MPAAGRIGIRRPDQAGNQNRLIAVYSVAGGLGVPLARRTAPAARWLRLL
jgi:hypothetical protein